MTSGKNNTVDRESRSIEETFRSYLEEIVHEGTLKILIEALEN